MTIESLDKLEALEAKATQGSWDYDGMHNEITAPNGKEYWLVISECRNTPEEKLAKSDEFGHYDNPNFRLIAALRNSASDLFGLAREALRLRQLVEDAPHDENCEYIFYLLRRDANGRRLPDAACNCWKAQFIAPPRDMAADKEKS